MTTSTLAPPVTGAPYAHGDHVMVEYGGDWRECQVEAITPVKGNFGLRWTITATLLKNSDRVTLGTAIVHVHCDDNGRNYTWRHQVLPSNYVAP